MQTIWGFDLGVTSVGFAVIRWDGWTTAEGAGEILRLGVRAFPETREGNEMKPLNAARRQKRLARRQVRRRRWRRVHLRALLAEAGLLSSPDAQPPAGQDPYALRAQGLNGTLSAEQAGWAIFHLLKRRGFQGSRKVGPAEAVPATAETEVPRRRGRRGGGEAPVAGPTDDRAHKDDRAREEAEGQARGEALAARMAGRPLAAYLQSADHLHPEGTVPPEWDTPRRRNVGQTRPMVREEFEALWAEQARHHPTLLTPELKARIETVALAQRPTFFRARTIGQDDLEPGEPRALKAEWLTQRFEMLQLVNGLRLEGGNQRELDPAERAKAIAYLETERRPTWAGLRAAIGIGRTDRFTHERSEKATIRGNATEAALRAALGSTWDALPEATRETIRAEIGRAWHRIEYRPVKGGAILEIRDHAGIAAERARLAERARAEWGLPQDAAEALSRIDLPDGAARYSLKAMRKLLPDLEKGVPYMTAVEKLYGTRRDSGPPLDRLPVPNPSELARIEDAWVRERMAALLAGIRNPTVLRTLSELRKVVNTLLRAHGRPDVIRLEFARDLKQSAEERRKTDKRQKEREDARKNARQEVAKLGKPADGPEGEENVLRWLLWKEQGGRCPYSGGKIGCAQALDPTATQIDHIFPVSRSFDDSQANKVLCFAGENAAKGQRTPFEWLSGDADRWSHLTTVVWPAMENSNWPKGKHARCLKATLEDPETDGEAFTNRQLVDTAFIARAARPYLGLLFGGGQAGVDAVQPVAGRATALLRRAWGIGLGKLLGGGEDGPKVREDLRHHAVDALAVALTTPRTVAELSRWWQRRETGLRPPGFPLPWPGFREQAKTAVEAILVSHRVQAKLSGPLHDEKPLGLIRNSHDGGAERFVIRKEVREGPGGLSAGEIERIVDPEARRAIERAVAAAGGSLKKAFASPVRLRRRDGSDGPIIRRVRVLARVQDRDAVDKLPPAWNERKFAAGQALHHLAIWNDNGRIVPEFVLKRDLLTQTKGDGPRSRVNWSERQLIFRIHPGDTLSREIDGQREFVVVKGFYRTGQVFLIPHFWGGPPPRSGSKKPGPLISEGWTKVTVDPIGRWRPAR